MARIGFWETLLDDRISFREADAINDAHERAVDAQYTNAQLEQRIDVLGRELAVLRAALGVLAKTLKDTDVLDDRLLDARMEAAMEEIRLGPERTQRERPEAPADPVRLIVCQRCHQSVPAATTTMTGDGAICDRCPGR